MTGRLVLRQGSTIPLATLGQPREDFGFPVVDLVRPPGRFWGDATEPPPFYYPSEDTIALTTVATPVERLAGVAAGDPVQALSRRSQARLRSWFLIAEDPQRRLDVRAVETLAHQSSLVQYVLATPGLERVMIADEVGLGKTIEAGLIVQSLLREQPGLRVLYLAPARLVANVWKEFNKLDLQFRRFAVGGDATFADARVIASIHRASHSAHVGGLQRSPAWDVIVVDECHHLSDWAVGGGGAGELFRLVHDLQKRLPAGGRLLLLSGTPHQGHEARFANLINLLLRPGESAEGVTGRVVFRTKEDVRDWDGHPLFPRRDVRKPTVVALAPELLRWLQDIRAFFDNASGRAGGWRCSQALQWATSSVQAGLGYLTRQAVRAGWDLKESALVDALTALRPYRGGPPRELLESLLGRIRRDVGYAQRDWDEEEAPEDQEEESSEQWRPDPVRLRALLGAGVALLSSDVATAKWRAIAERILVDAGEEKIVFFAQPIETVLAFRAWLLERTGVDASLIVGGQTQEERDEQIARFQARGGTRYLVSSRAGGEGINLQVSRWLVHLDVPWNPMDMEQRVGRVHRFGSRQTIRVDTVVTEGSPEARTYDIARTKLQTIASVLGHEEGFEALFSRVMSLIPPQEIQQVLLTSSPEFQVNQERIADLVGAGFKQWKTFHSTFARTARAIVGVDPGAARWEDFAGFLRDRMGAAPLEGVRSTRFRNQGAQQVREDVEVRAWRLADGRLVTCGPVPGLAPEAPNGEVARPLGLNDKRVVELLREDGLELDAGPAWLSMKDRPAGMPTGDFAVLVFARQTMSIDSARPFSEKGASLSVWIVGTGVPYELSTAQKSEAISALVTASVRTRAEGPSALVESLRGTATVAIEQLSAPNPEERNARIRACVHPIFAAIVI